MPDAPTEDFADSQPFDQETLIVEDDSAVFEQKTKPAETPWQRFKALFGGWRPDHESWGRRLVALDQRIADEPDAPGNYLLRGELFLHLRDYQRAYADFERGLELAQAEYASSDWGIVAQAMQDRAVMGLAQAAKQLPVASRQFPAEEL